MKCKNIKNIELLIAIDPDVKRNGVACLFVNNADLIVNAFNFPQTLDFLYNLSKTNEQALIVIEAGWLNKSHWHLLRSDSLRNAAAKGNAVGRNHEVGRKLAEMCEHWHLPYRLAKPLPLVIGKKHLWRGKDGKITATELKAITGYSKRTNQEERDAALLAWVTAGFNLSINKLNNKP